MKEAGVFCDYIKEQGVIVERIIFNVKEDRKAMSGTEITMERKKKGGKGSKKMNKSVIFTYISNIYYINYCNK